MAPVIRTTAKRAAFCGIALGLLSSIAFGQGSEIGLPGRDAGVSPAPANRLDVLRESIMTLLAPDSWDKVGGEASIVVLKDWNLLVVSQIEEVHVEIHEYLTAIQQIVAARRGDAGDVRVPVIQIGELRSIHQNRRIEEELSRPTQLAFDGVPLSDVAKALAESHGINVEISRRALDDAGIAADIPVRTRLENIPLRSALNVVLRELGLAYIVREGVLVITTGEDVHTERSTKVYDVNGLLTEPRSSRELP